MAAAVVIEAEIGIVRKRKGDANWIWDFWGVG